jgi:hypothetical protein
MIKNDTNNFLDADSMLPTQYFTGGQLPPFVQNEARLMLAILQDAVDSYQRHALTRDAAHREEFEEARKWIESEESEWVFSFENICNLLGINAEYVRDGLRRTTPSRVLRADAMPRHPARIRPLVERRAERPAGESGLLKIAS